MFFLLLICVAVIAIIVIKKRKKEPIINAATIVGASDGHSNDDAADDEISPMMRQAYDGLMSKILPNKHGEFNDMKKIGKTIEKLNEEVSQVYAPGTQEYVDFFSKLYHITTVSMATSSNQRVKEFTLYTLEQRDLYESSGKCQTFVKGLSEDPLVASAEVIMSVAEKCWFNSKKTTMWRKDMEKFNLPKSN